MSSEVGRLVDGWVALEEPLLRLRPGDPTRIGGYSVLGVRPAPLPYQTREPRPPFTRNNARKRFGAPHPTRLYAPAAAIDLYIVATLHRLIEGMPAPRQ